MAFFAGLITILALTAAEPAHQPAPGFAVAASPTTGTASTPARTSCDRYTAPDGRRFPFEPADPLGPFSEGEDDSFGEDLIEGIPTPLDNYPPRDDGAAFRSLWSRVDQGPAAGRALPRRC
ncbi:MAG: hypothetical protein U0800_12045 [Isosphaeraceae bacterium]